GGGELETIAAREDASGVRVAQLARHLDGVRADPAARVERRRTLAPGLFEEVLTLSTSHREPGEPEVLVRLASDGLAMDEVKAGTAGPRVSPRPEGWEIAGVTVRVLAEGAERVVVGDALELRWRVALRAQGPVTLRWGLAIEDPSGAVIAPASAEP